MFGAIDQRTAEIVIQKLYYLDGKSHDPIDFFLQTPGGELKCAFAIKQTFNLIKSPVNTWAQSECNSGGAYLLAAGTGKRRAFHGTSIVIHGFLFHGKPPPSDYIAPYKESYTEFWRKHAHLPQSWLPLPTNALHFLSAEQAFQYGLVDEVINK